MERTEYFNDTKPSETQLNNTEDKKIEGILTRFKTHGEFGIVSGLDVTINGGDNTKIDIGSGSAYTGGHFTHENLKGAGSTYSSGEYISVPNPSPLTAISLASYTLNVQNAVILRYTETAGTPLTDRGGLHTYNTIVTAGYTAAVILKSTWDGYTASQREECVLLAIVTGNGAGAPPVALTPANITTVTQPHTHPYSTQPSNITGVTIVQASNSTAIGAGTLAWTVGATKYLTWQENGDPAPGPNCNVTSSGTYQVYSNASLSYLIVTVEYGLVSLSNQTDTLTISDMYGRTIPMASAVDQAHRDMFGSGVISPNNPHGTSLNDITSGTFDHADTFHRNGIGYQVDADQLKCAIVTTTIHIYNFGGFSNSFLIDGTTYTLITGYGGGTDAILSFDLNPAIKSGWYMIYLDANASPNYVLMADYDPTVDSSPLNKAATPLTNIEIVDMLNTTAGTCTVEWTELTKTLTYQAASDAGPGTGVLINEDTALPSYYKIYSSNTANWIIVYVTGSLGGLDQTVTFATDMNISDHNEELILKLGRTQWKAIDLGAPAGRQHIPGSLLDIRQKLTSDNMTAFLEEHDLYGRHAVPLKDTLKVNAGNSKYGANIIGSTYGVVGIGFHPTDGIGVYGRGNRIGVEGVCELLKGVGVYGHNLAAEGTGVYGVCTAATGTGVCGIGEKFGAQGIATAVAGSGTGIYGYGYKLGAYCGASGDDIIGADCAAVFGNNVTGIFCQGSANTDNGIGIRVSGLAKTTAIGAYIYASATKSATGARIYAYGDTNPIGLSISISGSAGTACICDASTGGLPLHIIGLPNDGNRFLRFEGCVYDATEVSDPYLYGLPVIVTGSVYDGGPIISGLYFIPLHQPD